MCHNQYPDPLKPFAFTLNLVYTRKTKRKKYITLIIYMDKQERLMSKVSEFSSYERFQILHPN